MISSNLEPTFFSEGIIGNNLTHDQCSGISTSVHINLNNIMALSLSATTQVSVVVKNSIIQQQLLKQYYCCHFVAIFVYCQ